MPRKICVYLEYLTDTHRRVIRREAGRAGFEVRFFPPRQFRAAAAYLQECEVLFAHSPELLRRAPATLRWYCCAYAGVDPYCRDETLFQNPDCLLSNSAGAYGDTIAEHLVMVILMLLRRMPEYQVLMETAGWGGGLPVRSILGSRVTVLGTGDVGGGFARRARAMGASRVTGVSRRGWQKSGFDAVEKLESLESLLPQTDILVSALPGTPETAGVLSRSRIALLPPHAVLANVGRGSAVDQEALADALNSGKLAGAALDVMTPEPLPPDHPLRRTKNLILTPHVAGDMTLGRTCDRTVELFCADLFNYAAGVAPAQLVDRRLGY